jgi:hypothetical protein
VRHFECQWQSIEREKAMCKTKLQATSLAALLSVLVLAASPAAQAADGAGMRIVRDPVTGQLRAPTPEEFQAIEAQELKAKAAARATTAPVAPTEVRRADGSAKLMLDESQMSYAVVTRNADGSLTEHCVTGADAAQKVLSGKKVSVAKNSKNAKEHAHDHE